MRKKTQCAEEEEEDDGKESQARGKREACVREKCGAMREAKRRGEAPELGKVRAPLRVSTTHFIDSCVRPHVCQSILTHSILTYSPASLSPQTLARP